MKPPPLLAILISVTILAIVILTTACQSSIDEHVSFDFETNGTSGWENSTKPREGAISAVYASEAEAYQGQYSLAMDTHLDSSDPELEQGMALVMVSGDLEGRPMTAWVKCPEGAQGDPKHPNGIQLFVKDQAFKTQFAAWRNIGEDIPVDEWAEVRLTPSQSNPRGGHTDEGFDPTRIQIVGIKLAAGTDSQVSFEGTCYLDVVSMSGASLSQNFLNKKAAFVTRSGSQFLLDDQVYRFAGSNTYYLFYSSHDMIDDLMLTMQRHGIKVVRTWGFSEGSVDGYKGGAFQPEPGEYYEPTLVNFDYVIKSAGEHGIRLIIPLVNYWSEFGGMEQYMAWCGIADYDESGRISNKALFYTNDCTRQRYKEYVAHMLNRVNSLTGVPYAETPTILAWELANEPRCDESDGCPSDEAVYEWTVEMSQHIKALDANHLVGLGDEGFLNQQGKLDPYYNGTFGVDWERNLRIESIDFGTVHLYPESWGKDLAWAEAWISDHIKIAQEVGKPVVFEEFGVCHEGLNPSCSNTFDRDQVYRAWTKQFEAGAAGSLVWMIAGQVNSPNDEHVEIEGKHYYPNYDGFTFWEPSSTMNIISDHAACMNEGKC